VAPQHRWPAARARRQSAERASEREMLLGVRGSGGRACAPVRQNEHSGLIMLPMGEPAFAGCAARDVKRIRPHGMVFLSLPAVPFFLRSTRPNDRVQFHKIARCVSPSAWR